MVVIGACTTPKKVYFTPTLKQKSSVSVFATAPLVRFARARYAAQLGDHQRAQRELSLAADQAREDEYLQAAWKEFLEQR